MSVLLEGRGLVLRYGETLALDGVDLAIQGGEVLAVEGPSGSGKSSLMHCLAGLLRPTDGGVWFEGRCMSALGTDDRAAVRRRSFGFVFQFADLVPELSLIDNVALALELQGAGRRSAREAAQVMLDRLELGEVGGRRPAQVSGGQRQRAAVARAVVHRPAVVFADEPTGALDSATGALVLEELLGLAAEEGSAVILVTHDPRVAERCGRRVAVLDGRLVAPAGARA